VLDFEFDGVEPIFTGVVFSVERRHLRYDQQRFDREVVTHPGAVAIVAIDDMSQVILLEQFRAPIGERILEIPAGTLDVDGESGESAARRELIEETGLDPGEIEPLGVFLNSPGYSSQRTTIYLATQLTEVGREPVGIEEVDALIRRVDLVDAVEMVASGAISDAMTGLGILLASRHRRA